MTDFALCQIGEANPLLLLLRDINFYLAISYSISNLGLKNALKNALLACHRMFKSALFLET